MKITLKYRGGGGVSMIQQRKSTIKAKPKTVKKTVSRKPTTHKATRVRATPMKKPVRRSTLRATSTTAPFKCMDDVYNYIEKAWLTWEKKRFDDSYYEGYLDLIKCKNVDEVENILYGELSTIEWIREQLSNYIEMVIKEYPLEIYRLLRNDPRNKDEIGRAFKRYKITKTDVDKVSYNFILALCQVVEENYVEEEPNFRWFDRAMFAYEKLIWAAIHRLAKKTPKFRL